MSKTRVYMHKSKSWDGEPAEVWGKLFSWLKKRPGFQGKIEVLQYYNYEEDGENLSMSVYVESEPKEVER